MEPLSSYDEYRDSGSRWIGQIPAHWKVHRLGALLASRNERNRPELPLLSVAREKGVFVRSLEADEENHNVIPDDLRNYKVARLGDLVINKMKAWQGSMGIAPCDGIVSPAYYVFRLSIHDRAFGQRLLRSKPYVAHFGQASDGVRIGQWDLSIPGLRGIPAIIPPPGEQASIVRYLDWACGRLDRAIRAKRKIIALLNEQKQAVIQRAVTQGLDPNAPLKPSGINWLGDIPCGWKSRRAKYLFAEIDERSHSGGEELLSVSHLTGVTPRSQKNVTMFKAESYAGHKLCKPGDLVINTMWAWMGALGVSAQPGIVSPSYGVYRQRLQGVLEPRYIDMLLRTRLYVDEFTRRSTGIRSSRLRLYPEEFFNVEILLPPRSEQERIVEAVAGRTSQLQESIQQISKEVDRVHEYRTRLIADIVTGKLDVREAPQSLEIAGIEADASSEAFGDAAEEETEQLVGEEE